MTERKVVREYSEITIRFEIDDDNSEWVLSTAKAAVNQSLGWKARFTLTHTELKREYGPAEDEA